MEEKHEKYSVLRRVKCFNELTVSSIRYYDNWQIFFLSVVLAIVLVFGIYYITYLIAYVDKDMVVNYRLQGVHISQVLEKDINITSSFMRYIKYLIQRNNSTFVFSLSGYVVGQLSPSQGAQSMLGGIYFIADLIGFFVGFCFNIDGLKERKYSYSCGKYEKVMVSGKYALDNFNEAFQEFLVTGTFNLEQIKTYFYSKRNYVRMEIAYCPKCLKGEAEVGYFYKGLFRYERLVNEEEPCTEIDPEVIRKTVATFK